MYIKGLQKTTLLDFPSRVACTVFTAGCNFRCPFCHNASLVIGDGDDSRLSEENFFSFLLKRKGILDGVCITGGEPLMQKDIIPFIRKIRDLGFAVKLDTNGAYPDVLREIIDSRLVDYIAMDIKNSPERYAETAGLDTCPDSVFESVKLLMSSPIPYEFRTTVVAELHTEDDIEAVGKMISGADKYFLQCFKDSGELLCDGLSAPTLETLGRMQKIASRHVKTCEIRGI